MVAIKVTSRFSLCFYILFCSLLSVPTFANDNYQTCIACHGANGEGNETLSAPVLAGQNVDYLARQLTHFKKGIRASHKDDVLGQQMAVFAKPLDEQNDIPKLAQYIAQLAPPTSVNSQPVTGDIKNGSRYYQAKCGACHGGKAEGNPAFKAPKLSGQHHSYLARQMKHFADGTRGSHAKDKLGKQMAMMAKVVSDQELKDILFYISEQR